MLNNQEPQQRNTLMDPDRSVIHMMLVFTIIVVHRFVNANDETRMVELMNSNNSTATQIFG